DVRRAERLPRALAAVLRRLLPGGAAGVLPGGGAGRGGARARRHPPPLRPPAGDAAADVGRLAHHPARLAPVVRRGQRRRGLALAGLAGCALTQIGNVGPSLGQNYIVDSFMVVVTGGVGKLAGTILAAAGIGGLNKGIEPALGAVFAKVAILVAVMLFLQRR